jgi:hypothetical protein
MAETRRNLPQKIAAVLSHSYAFTGFDGSPESDIRSNCAALTFGLESGQSIGGRSQNEQDFS